MTITRRLGKVDETMDYSKDTTRFKCACGRVFEVTITTENQGDKTMTTCYVCAEESDEGQNTEPVEVK